MMLSKKQLLRLISPKLKSLGFMEFKDSKSGWQGLFCKKIDEKLYLSIGLTIHRYYTSAFTADFYLSKTTITGAIWGDIPKRSYERVGFLLAKEERSVYLEDKINVKGAYDIWWDGSDEKSICDFLRVVELTVPRFINQVDLIKQIEQSQDVKVLSEHAGKVNELVNNNQLDGHFDFLPHKEIDGIPMDWFRAAEKVLSDAKDVLNSHTVVRLAADAYRQARLSNV